MTATARVVWQAGVSVYDQLYVDGGHLVILLVLGTIVVVLTYLYERLQISHLIVIAKSGRFDLLLAGVVGGCLAVDITQDAQLIAYVRGLNSSWFSFCFLVAITAMGAATIRTPGRKKLVLPEHISFLPDDELSNVQSDCLGFRDQSKNFAGVVAAESARGGLVFGVDGPWGVGKSSFINFSQEEWEKDPSLLVFRFEPIKHLGEGDLVRQLIRELSGRIRRDHIAPELRPLASRYARMIRAEPSVSLPGVRLSLDVDSSTIDEIVTDVDEVLRRNGRRAIIVIDDLDRIDFEVINRVLFMIRRSRIASSITYVLVYDTERVIANSGNEATREYLEKFVNAKICLFADLRDLAKYLRLGWRLSLSAEEKSLSSTRILGLQAILSSLADLLEGEAAGSYVELLGNLRKIKRLINAMLLMGIEQVELNHTDFNRKDLLNLIVLHLNFPGVFREIYSSDGEGRVGTFSALPAKTGGVYLNRPEFDDYVATLCRSSKYLVSQLFSVKEIGIDASQPTSSQLSSLACFNSAGRRNLAGYLDLIVRFVVPDPLSTDHVYEQLLEKIASGSVVRAAIDGSVLKGNYDAIAKLFGVFASSTPRFNSESKSEVVSMIMDDLPYFSWRAEAGSSDRSNMVRSLAIIVNSTWPDLKYGSPGFEHNSERLKLFIISQDDSSIVRKLASPERRVHGVHDVLIFRLLCCADRGNQLRNIHLALARNHIRPTAALQSERAVQENRVVIDGLREISQAIFAIFRERYIDRQINFFLEAWADASDEEIEAATEIHWSGIAGFIIYQLGNSYAPTGSGIGCGFYDEDGGADDNGIAKSMNSYLFDICFIPESRANILVFADFCLSNFSRDYFGENGAVPTLQSLEQGLDSESFKQFWRLYHNKFKGANLSLVDRMVVTPNYRVTYAEGIQRVWQVLDSAYLDDELTIDE